MSGEKGDGDKRPDDAGCLWFPVFMLAWFTAVAINFLVLGWGGSLLWGWFVVPAFQAPPLSFAQAAGLVLLMYLVSVAMTLSLTLTPPTKKRLPTEPRSWPCAADFSRLAEQCVFRVLCTLTFVGWGWVIVRWA